MSGWRVRHEGATVAAVVPGPAEVVEGLRDGVWLPTDEVRGPNDSRWVPLELHPLFAEAAAEIEPAVEKPDDTQLDMNPLIDVCLVLLIFFILTISYETLRRSIEVPPEQSQEKGPAVVKLTPEEKDRLFRVAAYMDGDSPVVKVEGKAVPPAEMANAMKDVIERTGRREMYLEVNGDVPWGTLTGIIDAAKSSGVREILRQSTARR